MYYNLNCQKKFFKVSILFGKQYWVSNNDIIQHKKKIRKMRKVRGLSKALNSKL